MKYNINYTYANNSGMVKTSGVDLFVDISGKILYEPVSFLALGLQTGYRIANVKEMKVTESNITNIKKDDTLKDADDNIIEFDYSGFLIQGLILFSF
ncbi:MAG: hypothetical protein N3E50_10360 [Candidatus Goldbacteria bacterium]|nr:hypothetical protein [Candidatus Goldiibacteriota bacterium]